MFHPHGPTFWELVRQALSSTERGYDLLAPKFEHTPFRTPDPIVEATLACAGVSSVAAALDVCCGTGAAMALLRPHCRERVVGIDFSRGMLAEAERRLEGAPGTAAVQLVHGDVLDMPFEEEFELAVSFGAFGHILRRDEDRFVASIRRALAPGGRFVFATGELPPLWSARRLMAHGFNAAMRARNLLVRPPFVMYYLTFALPGVRVLLERNGLSVEVRDPALAPPLRGLRVAIATRV